MTSSPSPSASPRPRPYTLVAELSHRCPLGCPYCSNPLALVPRSEELPVETWREVLDDAHELGVVQAHFTGGEPLLYQELEALVAHAESRELYTHLVTSGLPDGASRIAGLARAGLSAVQLSLQDEGEASADAIADVRAHAKKLVFAEATRSADLSLTVNVVLHAANIGNVRKIVEMARGLGASRLELANTQYLGFALANRASLLPSAEAIAEARAIAYEKTKEHFGTMEILFVLPDYVRGVPRACMDGWGRRFVHVAPDGTVLPCHAASMLPDMGFEKVTATRLRDQWESGEGLARYRGTGWMHEPCASCDRREIDFGGCRCQAFALTNDAANTDPACKLSPDHGLVRDAVRERLDPPRRYLFRGRKASS